MKTTAQFTEATPDQKEAMVRDGIEFVAQQMEALERHVRILTGWAASFPDMVKLEYADLAEPAKMLSAIYEMKRKMDGLTSQCVNMSVYTAGLQMFIKDHHMKNAEKELQRMESNLNLTLKKYNMVVCKDRTIHNGNPMEIYHAQMTFTRRDDTTGYISMDGESFPDLFKKIADSPELLK